MRKTGFAFFIKRPRILEDLLKPHLLNQEHQYEIFETIVLSKIDYENFITDMLADRMFFENKSVLCQPGEVWKCLLIHQRGKSDGVLAIPEKEGYLGWAAYYPG